MKLTLLSKQEYSSITLPEVCGGQYWVRGINAQKKLTNIVAVEAVPPASPDAMPSWQLKSNRRFQILKAGDQPLQSSPLKSGEFYKIKSTDGTLSFVLYSEPLTGDRKHYDRYILNGSMAKITIGRSQSNHICYDNPYVTGTHAELLFTEQGVVLQDLNSLNHTYVNGTACQIAPLYNSDMIYIMGFKLWSSATVFLSTTQMERCKSKDCSHTHQSLHQPTALPWAGMMTMPLTTWKPTTIIVHLALNTMWSPMN